MICNVASLIVLLVVVVQGRTVKDHFAPSVRVRDEVLQVVGYR